MSNLKFYSLLAALAAMAVSFSVAVWHYLPMPTTPPPFNPDSAYVDSLLQDHHQAPSFISSDTADTSTQRVYDSSVRARYADTVVAVPKLVWTMDSITTMIRVMARTRDLEDSERNLYNIYAAGCNVTYDQYTHALKRYRHYFLHIYEPMRKRDSAWANKAN